MSERPQSNASERALIRDWLSAWGFMDNPFAEWEASREELLPRYFVEHPFYDDIRGEADNPRTAFVFAARGTGKSANRIMLERACRPEQPASDILAVPYTDFSPFLHRRSRHNSPSLKAHISQIMKSATSALMETLCQRPETIEAWAPEDRAQFRRLIDAHFPALLLLPFIRLELKRVVPHLPSDELARLLTLVSTPQVGGWKPSSGPEHLVHIFRVIKHSPEGSKQPARLTAFYTLQVFVDLARLIGLQAVYVLVDGVDEYGPTAADPAAGFNLIKTLTTELRLLEFPNLAFKFFLPIEIVSYVEACVRTDRLLIFKPSWAENPLSNSPVGNLQEMLRARVRAFNTDGHTGLAGLCEPGLNVWIDEEMVRLANGSPRDLMRLGALILSEHCRFPPLVGSLITRDEWERALERYRPTLPSQTALSENQIASPSASSISIPKIKVDETKRVVWIGDKLLSPPLTENEYLLLRCLFRQQGQICTLNDIAMAVYPASHGAVTDAAIGRLIYRLRQRLEPSGTTEPVYIKTIRGRGYYLDHSEQFTPGRLASN
jgi:DNA-binding winged helix-turn-helix (wHTH) protein